MSVRLLELAGSTIGGGLVLLVATLAAGGVQAAAVDYGTAEYVTVRSCFAHETSECDGLSDVIQGAYGGAPGAGSSFASTVLEGYGSAQGAVSLSGVVGAPILHALAVADTGARTSTNSVALQRYTYTGTEPTTRTFGGTLTYKQTTSGLYPRGAGGGVTALIEVFTSTSATIEVGETAQSNFEALSGPFGLPGYESLGDDVFDDFTSNPAGHGQLSVTVSLDPGDSVWVWVYLQTPAVNGSTIDAWHTLVTGWDEPANFVPSMVAPPVPEPASALLLGLGLAVVTEARRRRNRVQA